MKFSYDHNNASKLVPLLEAIFNEVADRRRSIRELERTLKAMKLEGRPSTTTGPVVARLATQRRELRLTSKEFERLGCAVDEHNPNRVFIPGTTGGLEGGYHWQAGESTVKNVAPEHSTF